MYFFQGIRTSIGKKPYSFVIFQGRGGAFLWCVAMGYGCIVSLWCCVAMVGDPACELDIFLCFNNSRIFGGGLVPVRCIWPPVALAAVRSRAVVLLLLIRW